MVEQIVMGALGKQFDPLWLVGGAVDPPAHFYGDHRILLAVQDENWGRDGADIALVVVREAASVAARNWRQQSPTLLHLLAITLWNRRELEQSEFEALDELRHEREIKRVDTIAGKVVVGITEEGRVGDHQRRPTGVPE
jgi:hypothetical protein